MKKRIISILTMIVLTFSFFFNTFPMKVLSKEDELILVTEAGFAPYEYYKSGNIVGVDIDIAKKIAEKLNKKLVIKDVAFDSIISEVKTGKSDLGAAGI